MGKRKFVSYVGLSLDAGGDGLVSSPGGTVKVRVVMVYEIGRAPYELKLREDLRTHSKEFAWGYCGSGPVQLALAILADYTGDDQLATAKYQDFKFAVIAGFDGFKNFVLDGGQIAHWLEYGNFATMAELAEGRANAVTPMPRYLYL